MNAMYIAAVINTIFRYTTPVLFAALGSLFCTKSAVFNVALEGQLLAASFVAIVANFYTNNMMISLLSGVAAGAFVGWVVAIFQIKWKVRDMVVGTAMNLLVQSVTAFLMQVIFGSRGTVQGFGMVALPKVNPTFLKFSPFLYRVFEDLSTIDYLGYIVAVLIYIYLYKTVSGFHHLSVGISESAAESLGVNSQFIQMRAIVISGILCGFGGVVHAMGNVTVFAENMTSGRGFIAMGAASMAQAHSLVAIASSLFFGTMLSLSKTLQGYINSYFTEAIPYISTVLAIAVYGVIVTIQKKKANKGI
ncbi:MAG: ABC transporter permease [Sphaerochaeta sp.]|jgi:simple sugar transport system permease protein|nr:ABC transporter permease [Sphaerochaeta sp.]